ncbi:MAG: hypothetical protein OXU20_41260, partial [Myxococcales bacterium]|nr:hypothetical protein [Myxococcales bacterium]
MQAKYRHLIIVTLVAMLSSFVSAAAGQSAPEMTSPTPGSTFDGPSATFSWSANDTAVNRWWLYVGTSRGSRDILSSGSLNTTSHTVTGLPTTGAIVHVRLWYNTGNWSFVDYQYRSGWAVCPCFAVEQLDALYDELVGSRGGEIGLFVRTGEGDFTRRSGSRA